MGPVITTWDIDRSAVAVNLHSCGESRGEDGEDRKMEVTHRVDAFIQQGGKKE